MKKLTPEEIFEIEDNLKTNANLELLKSKFQIEGCSCKLRNLIEEYLKKHR